MQKPVTFKADAFLKIPKSFQRGIVAPMKKRDLTLEPLNIPYTEVAYIGVDQSLTATGICVMYKGKVFLKTICIKNKPPLERLKLIRDAIREIIYNIEAPIAGLAIEGYSMGSIGRTFNLGELGGILRVDFYEMGLNVVQVPPSTLKKFSTGRGNAKKDEMIATAKTVHGIALTDDNQADAFFLALAAHSYLTNQLHCIKSMRTDLQKASELIAGSHPDKMDAKHYLSSIDPEDTPIKHSRRVKRG